MCIDLGFNNTFLYFPVFPKLIFFSYVLQCNNVHGGSKRGDHHSHPELSSQEPADSHNAVLGKTAKPGSRHNYSHFTK